MARIRSRTRHYCNGSRASRLSVSYAVADRSRSEANQKEGKAHEGRPPKLPLVPKKGGLFAVPVLYFQLVNDLLDVGHAGGKLLRGLAVIQGVHRSADRENTIL